MTTWHVSLSSMLITRPKHTLTFRSSDINVRQSLDLNTKTKRMSFVITRDLSQ